ncbi:RagB/SusD family nutrient uptake outer membrane protein [Pedobacter polaris]|uniref:RagB/SusD family nutrient uptake outer membrane protein n=1 Tax=Pedobacter polaris TaxID=2571273 RepID=A0A4U1CS80_9SPHI|nr:RagB/SusD family nutrient uptake outer membrane protein [Pedobacter polaris]TKC09875.1 RagB/SusD family nutrient uptake outer membrane protein [Pedobacter polaris]
MKNIKIINKIMVLSTLFVVFGCKKLDLAPVNTFTDLNYWTTPAKAASVLNTAYAQMFDNNSFFLNEAFSDNAYNGRGDAEGAASIAAGTYDPSLQRFKDEWGRRYGAIKTVHIILENIEKVPNMDPNLRERMKAEARFIRAFQFFQLTTWFGDVPLFQKDLTIEESKTISRSSRSEVLAFVLSELDAVSAILPVSYADVDKGRITKGAALGMKARVLLYDSRWQELATTCEQIMSANTYSLFPSYEGLFLPQNENNSEVIFDMQYVPLLRTYSNFFDYAPISVGARLNNFAPTQELVDNYVMLNGKAIGETGSGYVEADPYVNRDPRLSNTVVYHLFKWKKPDNSLQTIYIKPGSDPNQATKLDEYAPGSVTSPTGYYLRKYYDPNSANNFQSGLNLILIRYADVLLMYAEAKNELSQLTSAVWDQTIKPLRTRAGFTDPAALNFPSLAQGPMRTLIRNERRSELAMEGLRIFDIRRWRTAETVLNGFAHGAKFGPPSIDNGYIRANQRVFDPARNYLWPIPRDERAINSNLTQNPGYN